MDFDDALNAARTWVDDIDGVSSVARGEADGKPAIVVKVTDDRATAELPGQLHGHQVVVDPTGMFGSAGSLAAPE